MLTGADGSITPLESATTPLGKLLGVEVAMGARLVPIGAMRHVARVPQTVCFGCPPLHTGPAVFQKGARFPWGSRAQACAWKACRCRFHSKKAVLMKGRNPPQNQQRQVPSGLAPRVPSEFQWLFPMRFQLHSETRALT